MMNSNKHVYLKNQIKLLLVVLFSFIAKISFSQTYTFNDHIFSPILYLDTDTNPAVEVSDTWPVHPKYYDYHQSFQTFSSISDAEGNLMAYSHGRKIFGPDNLLVAFGDSLIGGYNTLNGSVFIPMPGSDKEVYLFHIAEVGEKGGYYTVLDPQAGAVNPNRKNIKIHDRVSAGRVMAVRHSNNYDWWVLFFSRSVKGEILAFKVTAEGVSSTPVYSFLEYWDAALPSFRSQFVMSGDGRLMAYADEIFPSYITRFDNYSGKVYGGAIDLDNGKSDLYSGFGACFSPYGCKLYISPDREQNIAHYPFIQLDVNKLDSTAIANSKKIIYRDTGSDFFIQPGHMFFGADGTIYCPYNKFVLRFHNPDVDSGKLVIDSLRISGNINYTRQIIAPNVIDKLKPSIRNFTYESQCLPDSTQFKYLYNGFYCVQYDSLLWDFGDPLSNNNTSTEVNPKHLYSAPGEYFTSLVLFNGNETDTISQYVTISVGPEFYLPEDTISCDGQSIGLRMDIRNSKYHTELNLYWNGKEGIQFYRADKSDTIIAKAMNQLGCVTTDTTIVNFSRLPKGNHHSYEICYADTVNLMMKTGSSMVYWNSDSSSTGWTENEKGTYYLTWKDGLKCEIVDTVTIDKSDELHMSPNKDTTICKGELVVFSVPAISRNIQWINGDTNHTLKVVNTGVVKVLFVDSFGCVFTDSIYFNVNDSVPDADFIFPNVCSGEQFSLESNGGIQGIKNEYVWMINGQDTFRTRNLSFTFNNPGTNEIILEITSSNGCNDSMRKEVKVLAKPIAGFMVDDVCDGDSVRFSNTTFVHSGYTTYYNWRFGDGNTSKVVAPKYLYNLSNKNIAETFFVTLVANIPDGCKDSISKTITINPLPDPYFEARINEGQLFIDSQTTKQVNYHYTWTFGNGDSSNAVTPSYTYTIKDTMIHKICLQITNDVQCIGIHCVEIKATLGIGNIANDNIKIFPNPTNGTFRIEGLKTRIHTLEVYDGKGVMSKRLIPESEFYDISDLPDGNYTLRITCDANEYIVKMQITLKD